MLTFLSFLKKYTNTAITFFLLTFSCGVVFLVLLINFNEFIYNQLLMNQTIELLNIEWYQLEVSLSFRIDMLSYFFALLVSCIGFFTNIYALNYFKYYPEETRFLLYLNWFIFSMLFFVFAENGFTLFLGWELIGVTSFLLINFWIERRGVFKAALKAFTMNKVSDALLLIFLVSLWYTVGHTNFSLLEIEFTENCKISSILLCVSTIGLIICSGVKSAQLFAHVWLPDSMEAPVPASALIHSATLVSAGVYLLLRFSYLINFYDLNSIIIVWGSATSLYGGFTAAAQTDIKKLLAYSTISHCGFLFVCVGFKCIWLAICYLFLHGMFKAVTFFCVGSFIRILHTQDSRQMGILSRVSPADTVLLIISAINLGGLPFTMGFFYKKFFLAMCFTSISSFIAFVCCLGGMLASVIYIYNLVYYVAFDYNKTNSLFMVKFLQAHENKINTDWSFTTIIHLIAVFGMLIFSFIFSNLLLNLCWKFSLSFTQAHYSWLPAQQIIQQTENLHDGYYIIFYIIYILISAILMLIDWRYSYNTYYRWYYLVMGVCGIIFVYISAKISDTYIPYIYNQLKPHVEPHYDQVMDIYRDFIKKLIGK